MKKILMLILLSMLLAGCNNPVNQNDLNGKWQVLIDDEEYYERWVSDSLIIWINSQGQIQTWTTSFSNNELKYEQSYDRLFDSLSRANFEEGISVLGNQLLVSVKPNSSNKYKLKKINKEGFEQDFRLIDNELILKEFKRRQQKYFSIGN